MVQCLDLNVLESHMYSSQVVIGSDLCFSETDLAV